VRGFYYRYKLTGAATEKFFFEHKQRLVIELEKRGMRFEVLF
jgi:hypothetical protein